MTQSQDLDRLDQSELRKLALVASRTDNSVIITNAEGHIEWVNDGFTRLTGYRLDEVIGQHPGIKLQGPRTDPAARAVMRHGVASGIGFKLEVLNYRKDGSEFWISMQVQPVRDAEGRIIQFIGIGNEVTERKRAEVALAAAHDENELILAAIPSALIGLDRNARVCRWNDSAEHIFGIPRLQALGKDLDACGLLIDWVRLKQGIADSNSQSDSNAAGNAIEINSLAFQRADGHEGIVDMSIVANPSQRSAGADALGMILMATDTTSRRHEEVQRLHGQKLESIGQLAAGVAHEINTPVQFIGDNLRFLSDSFADLGTVLDAHAHLLESVRSGTPTASDIAATEAAITKADVGYLGTEIPKAIAQSIEGVTRVADIVRAMKEFSHPDQGEKVPTDINRAIQTTLTVARNEYKYVADLVTDFAADLPAVPCLVGEFNQVILNLVVNAAHAIGDVVAKVGGKGTITVSTRRDGDHVVIAIRDTGTGIPESARAKIFDPFFTTKAVGKGTGQGLNIAHAVIVKKHAGSLTFATELGAGTTFTVRLPLSESSA